MTELTMTGWEQRIFAAAAHRIFAAAAQRIFAAASTHGNRCFNINFVRILTKHSSHQTSAGPKIMPLLSRLPDKRTTTAKKPRLL